MVPPSSLRSGGAKLPAPKIRVLFVCIGNSCRSQMAEGFARKYGSDVLTPFSAGLMPAAGIAPLTHQTMEEKNIRLDGHFSKGLRAFARERFDIAVNMSGVPIPEMASREIEWMIQDPIGQSMEVYRSVVNQIEALVMGLILELRSGRASA